MLHNVLQPQIDALGINIADIVFKKDKALVNIADASAAVVREMFFLNT